MERIEFDFSELRGRIIAKYGSCAAFAAAVHMGRAALSARLNGHIPFKPEDVYMMCAEDVLDIPETQIGRFFYTPKV